MAIYHCTVKTHSRAHESANHAVRSAAYRAGVILVDEASGNVYNYSRKDEVSFSEILTPDKVPEWAKVRQRLWSEVEKSEKRVDAMLFREVEVALPIELNKDEWIEVIREYVLKNFTAHGMIVDYSIHENCGNPHCHMMVTSREISEDGFGKKNRDWNDKKFLYTWRQGWETVTNAHLAKAGAEATIDCRSLKAQGLDRVPTVHEGRAGIGGQNADKVNSRTKRNRRIRADNKVRSDLRNAEGKSSEIHARIKAVDAEIAELSKPESSRKLTSIQSKMLQSLKPVDVEAVNIINGKGNVVNKPVKLWSVSRAILQSVKPIQPSTCTAIELYQAPRPKAGAVLGIRHELTFNLPRRPIESARCYALRELFGMQIDKEFNARKAARQNIGSNYSWQEFYEDINEKIDSEYGSNLSWWREYTKTVACDHLLKLGDIYKLAPPSYINHLNEYATNLMGIAAVKPSIPASQVSTPQPPIVKTAPAPVSVPAPVQPVKQPVNDWTKELAQPKPEYTKSRPLPSYPEPKTPRPPWSGGNGGFGM
jgi:hypothetical protein